MVYYIVCKLFKVKNNLCTIFLCKNGEKMEQFTLKELVKRRLDETYIIIYAIKNEVNIKKAKIIEKTDVYTFIRS